ncbi:hypothetical protein JTB14_025211 [Gonioctena quinquepunctata]|nr:hypothetical protein JTB14_025211 [Gonioctena quinquepunctata]
MIEYYVKIAKLPKRTLAQHGRSLRGYFSVNEYSQLIVPGVREFAAKWGPKWKVIIQDTNSESDDATDIYAPNIETNNKFQVLTELEETQVEQKETVISTKMPIQLPVMNTQKETKKPPPIIIRDKKNWPAICQLLKNLNLKSDKNFNDHDGIKVFYNNMETYKKCLEQLEHHKIEYFTFKTNTGKEMRAIFKGVTEDFSIDDITKDLRSKGFHPRVVARFQNRDKTPMSMILCIVPASDLAITKITSIMDVQVKFEHQRKQARTGQCYNCQKKEITLEDPLDPPRPQEDTNNGNKAKNSRTTEDESLRDLLAAMDELRELTLRRPILAGLIQLKNCQGATSPSTD